MGLLHGIISDRLRKKFPATDIAWTPRRPKDVKPMPKKGVQGVRLSSGHRKGRRR